MAAKKRTILTVLVVLTVLALLLGTVAFILLRWMGPARDFSFGDRLGVVEIEGVITESRSKTRQLAQFRKDKGIKAVVVRIDSPGGVVGPSQEIHAEVRKLAAVKPVVASMGAIAASGGYYVAVGANQIVANPGTITGSIGALMEFVRFQELLRKVGVELEVLKSGEFKDLGSPHRDLTKRERAIIQELVTDTRRQFVAAVAAGRKLPPASVEEVADGRIFSGERAMAMGLVDRLGNFEDAVDLARELAGVQGEATLVFPESHRLDLWRLILGRAEAWVDRLLARQGWHAQYR